MRITFEEALHRKEWLHSELMNSLNGEMIAKAESDQYFDVKLIVNGIETEPIMLNTILNNIEKCVDKEAKSLIREKFSEVEDKILKLSNMADEFAEKLRYELDN